MHSDTLQDWIPRSGLDVLLMLLYTEEGKKGQTPISGITRLDKMIFLLSRSEELAALFRDDYDFIPYNFGPFATELLDDLEALKTESLIEVVKEVFPRSASETRDAEVADEETGEIDEEDIRWDFYKIETYSLTDKGKKIAGLLYQNATDEQKKRLESVKKTFNRMSLMALLRYVYKTYPEYATLSRIGRQVLKNR